jgi:hypothetical protein
MQSAWIFDEPDHEEPLIERAGRAGYQLVSRQTDTGQVVWEWCNGHGPGPQFVSERLARDWMYDRLTQAQARRSTKA